jgi:hypothetical protein
MKDAFSLYHLGLLAYKIGAGPRLREPGPDFNPHPPNPLRLGPSFPQ